MRIVNWKGGEKLNEEMKNNEQAWKKKKKKTNQNRNQNKTKELRHLRNMRINWKGEEKLSEEMKNNK